MKKLLTLLLLLTMLFGIAAPAFAQSDNLARYTELLSNYSWKLAHSSTGNALFGRIQGIRLPNEYLFLTQDATGQIYLHNTLWFFSGIVTFSADEQVMVIMLPSAEAASKADPLYEIYVYRRQ